MYLPTFWKLTTEATMYRARHMAGYGVPVGFLGKYLPPRSNLYSRLDHVPLSLQLGVLLHHPTSQRCPQETGMSTVTRKRCSHGTNKVQVTSLLATGRTLSSKAASRLRLCAPELEYQELLRTSRVDASVLYLIVIEFKRSICFSIQRSIYGLLLYIL